MMQWEDFKAGFDKLTKAFTTSKEQDKGVIYYERLKKMEASLFIKTCEKIIDEGEKFPTISKIVQTSDGLRGFTGRVEQKCDVCDGFGTISMWKHTFRARCLHGEQVSKYIPLAPKDEIERKKAFVIINNEWKELYGEDLEYGSFGQSEPNDIVDQAKDMFGIPRPNQSLMVGMAQIFPKNEKGCLRWCKGQKYLEKQISMTSKLYFAWVNNGKIAKAYFGEEMVQKLWKSV